MTTLAARSTRNHFVQDVLWNNVAWTAFCTACGSNSLAHATGLVADTTLLPTGNGEALEATFHVGDTPFDVLAAQAAGVTPVGVATGVFGAAELTAAVPEAHILGDLQGEGLLELLDD